MRILAAAAALFLLTTPAAAQRDERPQPSVEQRVRKIEGELRAVQRRVFPKGAPVPADTPPSEAPATQQSVTDLIARVDALEVQMRTLTGQMEELQNADRQLTERMAALESQRIAPPSQPEVVPVPVEAAPEPEPAPVETEAPAPATVAAVEPLPSDPAEAAYVTGFRQYQARQYDQAVETLQAMAKKYPKHAKASWATNLAGRAQLDAGRPATAAELFFANYQGNPRGERAQDSLFYLGEALTKLDKREQACTVYQELETVYGAKLRAPLKAALPAARQSARCS